MAFSPVGRRPAAVGAAGGHRRRCRLDEATRCDRQIEIGRVSVLAQNRCVRGGTFAGCAHTDASLDDLKQGIRRGDGSSALTQRIKGRRVLRLVALRRHIRTVRGHPPLLRAMDA
jgi:hypothetical protein